MFQSSGYLLLYLGFSDCEWGEKVLYNLSCFQAWTDTSLWNVQPMCIEYGSSLVNMEWLSPWINRCVGFHNRKAFILMLFYTILITGFNILIALTCIQPIIEVFGAESQSPIFKIVLVAVGTVLNIVIFVAILNFFRFHISLILNNYTTI